MSNQSCDEKTRFYSATLYSDFITNDPAGFIVLRSWNEGVRKGNESYKNDGKLNNARSLWKIGPAGIYRSD